MTNLESFLSVSLTVLFLLSFITIIVVEKKTKMKYLKLGYEKAKIQYRIKDK